MIMSSATREALRAALGAARGDNPGQHAELVRNLQTDEVLSRLDSDEDYVVAAKFRLRVAQVVDALAQNAAPSAQQAFVALTVSPLFLAHDERIIALIRAGKHIRPAPPPLVAFWDRYCQPDDPFASTTVTALLENGSPPAVTLFENKLQEPALDEEEKIAWMRTDVLSHRNDPHLLEACQRLLSDELPEHLRPLLVEVLFDYRPTEWFIPAKAYSAPPLEAASREALNELIKTGVVALTLVRLTDEQRRTVQLRMQASKTLRDQYPR